MKEEGMAGYMNVCKSYQIAVICSTYSMMINELNEL